jgi:hypothetical protein
VQHDENYKYIDSSRCEYPFVSFHTKIFLRSHPQSPLSLDHNHSDLVIDIRDTKIRSWLKVHRSRSQPDSSNFTVPHQARLSILTMGPTPATKLGNIKLGLANSPKIAIWHQATEDGEKVILYENFPKDLAVTFSGFVAKAFNAVPLSQIPLSEPKPKSATSFLIKGGKREVHEEVLEWILACGKAGRTVAFRWLPSPAFYHYGLVLLSCQKLQINVLATQIQTRMRDVAAFQVHSIDVERVFTSFLGPHTYKDMVCESIGQALWEGRLQAFGAYKALWTQKEYQDFKQGTDAVYDKLKKQWYKTAEGKVAKAEEEEKARKAEEKRQAAKERRENNFKRTVAQHHNVSSVNIQTTGNGRYTLTTDGRQVRKGHGGRPGFVEVNLRALGVTAQQFRVSDFTGLPRKAKQSIPDAEAAATKSAAEAENETPTTWTPTAMDPKDVAKAGEDKTATKIGEDLAKVKIA